MTLATVIFALFIEPAEVRIHFLHLFTSCVKGMNREMSLGPEETLTNGAGPQKVVILSFAVPDDLLDCLLATCASLHVDIEITARTDESATIRFFIGNVIATASDPAAESFKTGGNVIKGKGS